jgi:hypothetical protein
MTHYAGIALLAAAAMLGGCNDAATDAGANEAEATPALAEATHSPVKLVGEYKAFLYGPDHTDQSGNKLTEAWQVLREDRANFPRARR